MPPSVNTMSPRSATQLHSSIDLPNAAAPAKIEGPASISIRDFMEDEDVANFNDGIWKTIDQKSFALAQSEAMEAYHLAKALRLSKETAAEESRKRLQDVDTTVVVASANPSSSSPPNNNATQGPVLVPLLTSATALSSSRSDASSGSQTGASSGTLTQPIPIKREPTSDEEAARSLARSWQVEALQPVLLQNPSISPYSPTYTSTVMKSTRSSSSNSTSLSIASTSAISAPSLLNYERKASTSSSGSISLIAKQPSTSQTISLSTSSTSFVIDNRIASPIHSRASSQSNFNSDPIVMSSNLSSPFSIKPTGTEQRLSKEQQSSLSKRNPDPTTSMPSTFTNQISDVTNTKRRRTERQPSISSSAPPYPHAIVVAPSLLDSKKSTAASRDDRLSSKENANINANTTHNLKPLDQPRPHRKKDVDQDTSDSPALFTATRDCEKCGSRVESPRSKPSYEYDPFSHPFVDLLHVTCSNCKTRHCRGCFTIAKCPADCPGGSRCTVQNCCSSVRAIAIFEALSSFDHIYASEVCLSASSTSTKATTGSKLQRQGFIKDLIARADRDKSSRGRKFEDAFVRTLRILRDWLKTSGNDNAHLHPTVSRLFTVSYLPEVIQFFLTNTNVRDWVAHSETYEAVLAILRSMFESGLSAVLMEPMWQIEQSPGVHSIVWDFHSIVWEKDAITNRPLQAQSLIDSVRLLEAHRRPLKALSTRVQYSGTIEKVNNLCDGISYLLLQQIVGGF